MNFIDFKNKFQYYPLISSFDIFHFNNTLSMQNQISRWTKKGLLVKLKRELYVLNSLDRKIEPDIYFIANQLYSHSYVSLEYALSYYELIPETTVMITSVTSKKTALIKNSFGIFSYRHVKLSAFRGFQSVKNANELSFFIAEPEKAIVDFLYFNLPLFKREDADIFEESYRFQNLKILSQKKIKFYASLFNNNKLSAIAENLCSLVRRYKK